MLKIDFHTHTAEDRRDFVKYTARDLIDRAAAAGFDALAVTCHDAFLDSPALVRYAAAKGLLLLPGVEITASHAHIVVINPRFAPCRKGYDLREVPALRREESLFIAAHPYFPFFPSLRSRLVAMLPWIDAIEFTSYHNALIDFNREAVRTARRFGKPLVGNSDCHNLVQFGRTYTLVDAEKSLPSIVRAVRAGRCELRTTPISIGAMAGLVVQAFTVEKMRRIIENRW
jgi:predicted metal-dependent phosphoesterase TrpH